jgi:membrane protease subunit (stomatin/prohibitin family)
VAIIGVIKYDAFSDNEVVFKYDDNGENAITLGSQLVVNQAQEALFVKSGQACDLFGPGTHTLTTGNLPLLRKLVNLPFGGKTPFTAEVWFINKTVKRDMRWGTSTPIQIVDRAYDFPVSIRSHGRWGFRIEDSRSFVTQIVGTLQSADSEKICEYFIGEIVQRLSGAIAKYFVSQGVSIFDMAAKINDLSKFTQEEIRAEFSRFGIEIINFNVESITITDEEMKQFQEVLKEKMKLKQLGPVPVGQGYVVAQTFNVLGKAAENPAGGAGGLLGTGLGLGMGLGAGVPLGQQLGQTMKTQCGSTASSPQGPAQPVASSFPASTPTIDDPVAKLKQLKQMLDDGLISQEEFDTKKKDVLNRM